MEAKPLMASKNKTLLGAPSESLVESAVGRKTVLKIKKNIVRFEREENTLNLVFNVTSSGLKNTS